MAGGRPKNTSTRARTLPPRAARTRTTCPIAVAVRRRIRKPDHVSARDADGRALYVDVSQEGQRRRFMRSYRRLQRRAPESNARPKRAAAGPSGSRRRCLPCCQRRLRDSQCACDYTAVEQRLQPARLNALLEYAQKCPVAFIRDTADGSVFLHLYRKGSGEAWQARAADEAKALVWTWRAASMYRYHDNPTLWLRLVECGAMVAGAVPKWDLVEKVLSEAWAERRRRPNSADTAVFSGRYIPPVLVEYRDAAGAWHSAVAMGPAARDALAYRLLWEAAPAQPLRSYALGNERREAYQQIYTEFRSRSAASMKGVVADYIHKCILDFIFASEWMDDADVAIWPGDCPGYRAALLSVFPGLPKQEFMQAMCYVFRAFCSRRGTRLRFPEAMALLCWWKRAEAGRM